MQSNIIYNFVGERELFFPFYILREGLGIQKCHRGCRHPMTQIPWVDVELESRCSTSKLTYFPLTVNGYCPQKKKMGQKGRPPLLFYDQPLPCACYSSPFHLHGSPGFFRKGLGSLGPAVSFSQDRYSDFENTPARGCGSHGAPQRAWIRGGGIHVNCLGCLSALLKEGRGESWQGVND